MGGRSGGDAFFGVGNIQINKDGSITYSVTSIKDLTNVIIPHFCKYPLLTQKQASPPSLALRKGREGGMHPTSHYVRADADFELFRRLVEFMNHKEHLTTEGLHKILSIRATINKGLPERLKAAFPDIIPVSRPEVKLAENIDPNWFAGFVDAEGSFIVSVYKSKTTTGYAVKLIFSISQNQRDSELLSSFVKFLNCGRISENPKNSAVELIISKFSDIENKILPLFNKYPLLGTKRRDYEDFCQTCTPPPPSIIIFRPYSFFSLSRPRSCTLPPSLSFFERKRRRGACKEREKKVKEDEGGGGVHEQGRVPPSLACVRVGRGGMHPTSHYVRADALLMKNKVHLTNEGLEQIRQIKSGMNRRRTK
nr:hypothetical protein [Morchella crassipes]